MAAEEQNEEDALATENENTTDPGDLRAQVQRKARVQAHDAAPWQ